jgi:hypothetical protein
MYNLYLITSISPTASLLKTFQIFHNPLKYDSIAGLRVHSSGRSLVNQELNFMLRLTRVVVEFGICTANTPPNGPSALLFDTLTRQRPEIPLIVPMQEVPEGISTANACPSH